MSKDLNASIDAVLNRAASIEVNTDNGPVSLQLRSPTVEKHLEMRKIQNKIREDESKKDFVGFLDTVATVQACLVGEVEFNKLSTLMLSLDQDERERLVSKAYERYGISYANNKTEVDDKTKKLKLNKYEDIVKEEVTIPFLLQD